MKIIVTKDYNAMSAEAAKQITSVLWANPRATLGLATGSTVLGTYELLVKACASGEVSFRNVTTFNLDEYVGLGPENKNSYAYYMKHTLFDRIDIDICRTHLPCGVAADLAAECAAYTALLKSNRRDVQLLGIGSDGHIAFNEPGSDLAGHTHVVALADSTINDNSRLFNSIQEVPRSAITMGVADILDCGSVLILANGKAKARAVRDMIKGEVTPDCPASALQTHNNVTVILDMEAASLL